MKQTYLSHWDIWVWHSWRAGHQETINTSTWMYTPCCNWDST